MGQGRGLNIDRAKHGERLKPPAKEAKGRMVIA
jgi:hypothetical protein